MLGQVLWCLEEYEAAEAVCTECLPMWQELGNRISVAGTLYTLGCVTLLSGDVARGQAYLTEGLANYTAVQKRRGVAMCLEGLAAVALAQKQPERAARLLGAAAALREAGRHIPYPAEQSVIEQSLAAARAAVDEATFTAAWEAGRALTQEQAVAEALGVQGRAGGVSSPDEA